MDCSHGILQARTLEWVAFPFSRWSFQPRDKTQVSCIAGGFFTSWATREAQESDLWREEKKNLSLQTQYIFPVILLKTVESSLPRATEQR